MRFARWVFFVAGLYGVPVVAPLYFFEERLGQDYPPAITHPEFYYGFAGTVLAWQIMYLMIGLDPVRYRMVMLLGAAAKTSFAVAVLILYQQGRVAAMMVGLAAPDALLAVLFVAAWLRMPRDWPKVGD
ncbi:MAG: hypothetical protein HY288_20495 [Planctomycetia bacterium]|nr:hypothetical protein [Planctomycetia bacterium]